MNMEMEMNKNNDVTLAICMYNAERYIAQTLGCVMAQTTQDFHLLIVDDCSTDGSVRVVEQFFREHPRQHEVVRQYQNQGIAYERDFALRHAQTKYLVFVDADDFPLPQLIEKERKMLVCDQELTAVSSGSQFADANCNRLKGGLFIGDTTKESFRKRAAAGKRMFLPIQTMFVREDAIRVGGFRLDGFPEGKPRYRDFCEDLDLWTRMSDLHTEGKCMVVIPEVLYLYRKAEGLSSNHFNMIIKMEYVKVNVRRRRAGKPEITFCEYLDSMPSAQLDKLHRDAKVADDLRNGFFYIKDGKLLRGLRLIVGSMISNPSYICDKIISNSGLIKKK